MLAYTIRRLLVLVPVLWAVATITFVLMHAVPGGPLTPEKDRPPALQAALERRYGLDQPLWRQYTTYLTNIMRGDLGITFKGDREVTDVIREKFFVTAQVGLLGFAFAVFVGMTLGTLSALNHNGPFDYAGVFFATFAASVPSFILGSFLTVIFAVNLGWFDIVGWGGPNTPDELFDLSAYDWRKIVLPVIAISALPASYFARVTRASVLEVLNQDYIRTARAKGLAESRVVIGHAVKNALIPVLTLMGPTFAVMVSGSFIIETMFFIPGLGAESIKAIVARDYGIIMGTTIFFAFLVAIANLAVDLAYAVADPRIRYR